MHILCNDHIVMTDNNTLVYTLTTSRPLLVGCYKLQVEAAKGVLFSTENDTLYIPSLLFRGADLELTPVIFLINSRIIASGYGKV